MFSGSGSTALCCVCSAINLVSSRQFHSGLRSLVTDTLETFTHMLLSVTLSVPIQLLSLDRLLSTSI